MARGDFLKPWRRKKIERELDLWASQNFGNDPQPEPPKLSRKDTEKANVCARASANTTASERILKIAKIRRQDQQQKKKKKQPQQPAQIEDLERTKGRPKFSPSRIKKIRQTLLF